MDDQNNENKKIKLINKSKRKDNFLVISNDGYPRDIRLSFKAKGILTLMLTNKADWEIHYNELLRHSKDGISALSSGCKELSECKYINIEKHRDGKGHYCGTTISVFDEPYDGSPIPTFYTKKKNENPELDNPKIENPISDYRKSGNTYLTKKIIEQDETELTDSESETKETVSESDFVTNIKDLFGGEYPFDKNFESDVHKRLSDSSINVDHIESYLKYVYERTKLGNVKKSFEGLFRKLALSNSIARDFKNSSYMGKTEESKKAEYNIKYVDCPICATRFNELENYCPTCSISIDEIRNPERPSFIFKKKYFEMTKSEKQKYDIAYSKFEEIIKTRDRKSFLSEGEKIQFWKQYGIID